VRQGGVDVAIVGRVVFPPYREYRYPVHGHQSGRHVILCGEGVAGAEGDASAAVFKGQHEVGGLGGDVEAGAQAQAC